ncbi:hypothetical protein [Natronolimnohabitans innermongolicus]|uniref:Uncharacterized protein n=1 Tax=Natronolimnohabitans innermongolicus JCM 12255 TaxID=1227499 RepID=L9XMJ6_9EURY|nr:hypothetical protein [Natronolimnohabitans innermongolicus]ELY61888.1 hypothetical protein C493_01370 [Natronolimnohabitans innermongolicus JCM 12255]
MDEQTVSRSVPGSVGLLGVLSIVALAVLGLWAAVDGFAGDGSEYLAPSLGVFAVTAVVVVALAASGARSKQWREGPYW